MPVTPLLKRTPLHDDHLRRKALLAPFAGWEMPISYEGILAETLHTRRAVSVFDICHMGEFLVTGDLQRTGLDRLVTARLVDLAVGACRYGSMLDEKAGVLDDLIVYRRAPEQWMIVVNAGTLEGDAAHMKKNLKDPSCFEDLSLVTGKIDLQGPLSRDVLIRLVPEAGRLAYYTFFETKILGHDAIVSRTGYTGELGFEIYIRRDRIPQVWAEILNDARVKPAGLGARDILRLEMGYSLYGHDVDTTTNPLEAGLERYIDWTKDFIGKPALERERKKTGARRRVFFQTLSRRSPRHGQHIYIDGRPAGSVTSGSFSPFLEKGIGMGFLNNGIEARDIQIGDDRLKFDAILVKRPFLTTTSLKN